MRDEKKDRRENPLSKSTEGKTPIVKALMAGQLDIDGTSVPCFVLEDGRRVITAEGISAIWAEADLLDLLEKVHPYLREDIGIIVFAVDRDGEDYRETRVAAEKLIDICCAISKVGDHGQLLEWAPKARAIIRASFIAGLKALTDDRTGYQYEGADNALRETFAEELRKE
jgi:hypothetical protein